MISSYRTFIPLVYHQVLRRTFSRQAAQLSNSTPPQGVQDCGQFHAWLDNCEKNNLNCDASVQGVQEGHLTLSQVFREQDRLIKDVADRYQDKQRTDLVNDLSIQGDIDQAKLIDLSLKVLISSPQGIQGDQCERFNIWMENCLHFGLRNCADQLKQVQSGRRTLADIFDEQERLISSVAQQMQQRRAYSTLARRSFSTSAQLNQQEEKGASEAEPKELSQRERLKRAVKEYGATVVVFHVCISLISLGGFYLAVSSGIDVIGMLTKLGVGQGIMENRVVAGASTFVVAYAVHKVFAPVRIAITLTSTPLIVKRLRKVGFLKPPAPK